MRAVTRVVTILLALGAAAIWTVALFPQFCTNYGLYYDPETFRLAGVTLTAAACFGWLLIFLAERQRDALTRCRACGHILRGLSEPRCPECGERI